MVFVAKIRLIVLFVLTLSAGSFVIHLWMTKHSSSSLTVDYAAFAFPYSSSIPEAQSLTRNKKLWGPVTLLEPLKPYSNPRSPFPVPSKENNGFIYAKIFGGFDKIRSSICDLVAISRLLNATLVIPELQEALRSKGVSYKFKSFSYLYDEEQFVNALQNDVVVVSSLPQKFKAARQANAFPIFKPKGSASPKFYLKEVLPKLKKDFVVGLIVSNGSCLQANLPRSLHELQRLRCRVAFHALQFRSEIQLLGRKMTQRLKAFGQPVLSYHPGLVRDLLAYNGCAELFQDLHTVLIQTRRAQFIKQGIVKDELTVDSHVRRDNGSCPLMPEEVALLMRAMGYPRKTILYIAGSETFGGQRVLIPLHALFPNSIDRSVLCTKQEITELFGPEIALPEDSFQIPPARTEKQRIEYWNKAGPRPRPLPPPPDRPIYLHEKKGWYGWITEQETEPKPTVSDTRRQAHQLLYDALDYIVSVEADAFFPGFTDDDGNWPDFSTLVLGQRLYERAASVTYRPERKVLTALLNQIQDNLYHLKRNWTEAVRGNLNKTAASFEGMRHSFIGRPFPECMCRMSSAAYDRKLEYLYSSEECPKWMSEGALSLLSSAEDRANEGELDYDEMNEVFEADDKNEFQAVIEQDEEWDPND